MFSEFQIALLKRLSRSKPNWLGKNVMETTFYASGQKYNVKGFNLNQEYEDRFNGVQFYGSAVYDGIITESGSSKTGPSITKETGLDQLGIQRVVRS